MKLFITILLMLPLGLLAQNKSDTLVIPKTIKVIVIDGESYDIIRTTEIKKSFPLFQWNHTGTYTMDSGMLRIKGNPPFIYYNQNNKP